MARLLLLSLVLGFLGGARGVVAQIAAAPAPIVALGYDRVSGTLYRAYSDALHRSVDEGLTWQPIAWPNAGTGEIAAVAVAAAGGGLYVAGPGLGVLALEPDGAWTSVNGDLPSENVVALTAHADQPTILYAFVPEVGIFRTRDAGGSWQLMDRGPGGIRLLVHSNMAGSMETGWLYAGTHQGLQVSMDCFCLWRAAATLGAVNAVAYNPTDPTHLYMASEQGIHRSVNGGLDWEEVAAPPGIVTALVVTVSGDIYASVGDRLFRSTDDATSWVPIDG